jgi:hypothetical protein
MCEYREVKSDSPVNQSICRCEVDLPDHKFYDRYIRIGSVCRIHNKLSFNKNKVPLSECKCSNSTILLIESGVYYYTHPTIEKFCKKCVQRFYICESNNICPECGELLFLADCYCRLCKTNERVIDTFCEECFNVVASEERSLEDRSGPHKRKKYIPKYVCRKV